MRPFSFNVPTGNSFNNSFFLFGETFGSTNDKNSWNSIIISLVSEKKKGEEEDS